MNAWVLAARPKTLSAAVVPVLLGASLAGRVVWWVLACALAGALLIQIATNFINDALDFRKGADTGERLGPLRVTAAGLLTPDAVMRAAYICLMLAALCGIPLIVRGGWPLLAIGVASIIAAYLYTGGPYPLAYHGLGELFVILFFGLAAVGGTYYVLTLRITPAALIAGFAAGSLACVLLAINNLRDLPTDARSNKKTMAVRFGPAFARAEIALFAIAPFVCAAIAGVWLPLLALPIALIVIRRVFTSDGAALNGVLAVAGALQWAFGILWVCSFIVIR
ncbi:MAG TPA: 1,4-dihydroxy-2-naphthoate polyprenyltransferase [Thermoanaerobaculia bacterium]|nr:1,4-dihydroxy-2-naphthoate polyprenyltransferase [Thermoanaerobaculia bacterium]